MTPTPSRQNTATPSGDRRMPIGAIAAKTRSIKQSALLPWLVSARTQPRSANAERRVRQTQQKIRKAGAALAVQSPVTVHQTRHLSDIKYQRSSFNGVLYNRLFERIGVGLLQRLSTVSAGLPFNHSPEKCTE